MRDPLDPPVPSDKEGSLSDRVPIMKIAEAIVRLVVSPGGAALDRFFVHVTGHSFVSFVFARGAGVQYNAPMLLTTIGAVTGKKRTVVLPPFTVKDSLCVVASRGGSPTDPYWARNLRADPTAWVRFDRKTRSVKAHFAAGPEREALWERITQQAPIYLDYADRARTHREIPVIVLRDT